MDYVTPKNKLKVTTMTFAAAVATAVGVDADTANHIAKAERPFAGCCHRCLWSLQESPVENWNLVVEWTSGWSYTREACMFQSLQCPEEGRYDGGG